MTRSEIHKKLNNTKVYLGKYSEEVQKKLFELGYSWNNGITYVSNTNKPFLFISTYNDLILTYSDDLKYFNEHSAKEITVEDILGIEEDVNTSFKNKQELLEEMAKHSPFGWIQDKSSKSLFCISRTHEAGVTINGSNISFDRLLKYYTFLDGSICGVS